MEAVLNVQNMAYCKIEIEDTVMQPSYNLVDHIVLQEGLGIAVPTMTLYLFDQSGSLQTDLNLVPGTKCTLSIGRDSQHDRIVKRTFSLWGMSRGVNDAGPHLQVTFILEVPKWSAGVYCESIRGTSSSVIGVLARRSGLRYSGPDSGTDDNMNWLNVNTTRSSFSEDVAMRGFASGSSCMLRALTLDSEVRYKDVFSKLQQQEDATLLHNTEKKGPNPYPVKENKYSSMGGVMSHWFNYGQIQYEHSLNDEGQQSTDKIRAPVLGDSFPISSRIKDMISDSIASRVTYTGFDPGTEPKPDSNIHSNYERAFYQNLRSLGLFTEKMRSLLTVMSDIHTLDVANYQQSDPVDDKRIPSKAHNGKYLVAGKTIRIKNGHIYSEVIDLIRPYVSNPGQSNQIRGKEGKQQVKANRGPFNLTEEVQTEIPTEVASTGTSVSETFDRPSDVDSGRELMKSLDTYDKAVPRVPKTPLTNAHTLTPSSSSIFSGTKIRNALGTINQHNRDISDMIERSKGGFNLDESFTIKRIAAPAIETSANSVIEAMDRFQRETGNILSSPSELPDSYLPETIVNLDRPVLDRFAVLGSEITNRRVNSIVSRAASEATRVGDIIGDIQNGGVFVEDFLRRGFPNPKDFVTETLVPAIEQEANRGANFIFPASNFGIGADDVAINPKFVADALHEYAEARNNPIKYLRDNGAEAYRRAFGNKPPTDAKQAVDELARLAKSVADKFGSNEFLVDQVRERLEDVRISQRKQSAGDLGLDSGATIKGQKKFTTEEIRRDSSEVTAQTLDFQFGQTGVAPLIERVTNKYPHTSYDVANVVETQQESTSWAQYASMGNAFAQKVEEIQEGIHWKFPYDVPFEVYDDSGDSESFGLSWNKIL